MLNRKVSIITVNYNGESDTCELIDSLRTNESHPYEIIVVDNGSSDPNEYLRIKEKFHDVTVLRSEQNLGFAGGNNYAIPYVSGSYILFLNNDTIITKPILEQLVSRFEENSKIGCIGPKVAGWPDTQLLQYAGATDMTTITLRNRFIGFKEIDNGQYDHSSETAFVHGAAMMIRTQDIEGFGLMDESYFLYYEELDWCTRIRKAGFQIWYEADVKVYHKESISVGTRSSMQIYYHTRNRLLFAKRTITNKVQRNCSYLYQIGIAFPKNFISYLMKKEFHLIPSLCKGIVDGATGHYGKKR